MEKKETVVTKDLWLAGFLVLQGAKFIGFDEDRHGQGNRLSFVVQGEDLSKFTKSYYDKESVSALDYKGAIIYLKQALFRELNTREEVKK